MKKVVIDQNTCIGCGSCSATAPKTFVMDDASGKAKPIGQLGDDEKTIQEAVDNCPVAAISIEE